MHLLHPIAEKKVDWIIHKLLNIWSDSRNFSRIGIDDINDGYEKIIQVLLSLSIPPWKVIESVQQYIVQTKWVVTKQKKDFTADDAAKHSATPQSLYC